MNKVCSKCNLEKDEIEFYNCYRLRKKAWCKSCTSEYTRKNYLASITDLSEAESLARYIKKALYQARYRAKQKNVDFNLTEEDIVVSKTCPVLGIPIILAGNKPGSHNSPSLDRIDNTIGYVKGNVIVISDRANRLKKDATLAELQKMASFYSNLSCN